MLAFLLACSEPSLPDSGSLDTEPEGWAQGPEVTCDAPTDGFWRLTEQGASRGLDLRVEQVASLNANGGVAAEDLDGDRDLDLIFANHAGAPKVYENDGTGHFSAVEMPGTQLSDAFGSAAAGFGVLDLDADGRPDLVQVGLGLAIGWRNQGGLVFADPPIVLFHDDSWPKALYGTFTAGDLDGDGDLDVVLPGLEEYAEDPFGGGSGGPPGGTPERVLLNQDGTWVEHDLLTPDGRPGVNITGTFTDRDSDGDPDLLIPADLGQVVADLPPSAFYRNDDAVLTNDAPAIGADLVMSSMGIATGDYNHDGTLDYCMSDVGPLRCLLSDGAGGYYDGGQAMGLVPGVVEPAMWSGWGLEIIDLDNDGILDAAVAGGRPLGGVPESFNHPDHLFRGVQADPLTFEPWRYTAFDDLADNYGLVAADFDGDGYVEVVVMGAPGPPLYWQNTCGEGAWLEVRLRGPPGNPLAIGARVEVHGQHTQVREVQTARGMMQSPARQHFGLGDQDTVDVRVIWPDGAVSSGTVGTRRHVAVVHPESR